MILCPKVDSNCPPLHRCGVLKGSISSLLPWNLCEMRSEASPFFPFGESCVKVDGDRSKCLGTAVRNLPRPRQSWTWSQSAAVKRLLCTQTLVQPSLEERGDDSDELLYGSPRPLEPRAYSEYLSPPSFTTHYDTFDFGSTVTQPRSYSLKPTTAPLTYSRTLIDLGKSF